MSKAAIIQKLEAKHLKKDIPHFRVGDTVRVHMRIIEGQKERIQVFMGTVIARKGYGLSETFSIHRVAYGEGMERVFLLHSPRIARIEIVREGDVRRAKLYYLRGKQGKAAKVKGRVVARRTAPKVKEQVVEPKEEVLAAELEEKAKVEIKEESKAAESQSQAKVESVENAKEEASSDTAESDKSDT